MHIADAGGGVVLTLLLSLLSACISKRNSPVVPIRQIELLERTYSLLGGAILSLRSILLSSRSLIVDAVHSDYVQFYR